MKLLGNFLSVSYVCFTFLAAALADADGATGDSVLGALPVIGPIRIGKGTLITEAVQQQTGKRLSISSDKFTSHSSVHAMYDGTWISFVDTVGWGDGDGESETAMLNMLKEIDDKDIYPPLVVIWSLDAETKLFLDRLSKLFTQFAIAVRTNDDDRVDNHAVDELAQYKPLKVFYLPEFLKASASSSPQRKESAKVSRQEYDHAVSSILDFYEGMTPKRANINFDADMFKGEIENQLVKTERKEEEETAEKPFTVHRQKDVDYERPDRTLKQEWECWESCSFWRCKTKCKTIDFYEDVIVKDTKTVTLDAWTYP
ncbi:expressed unknown protein [Seminavis robusta]|uniref:Signal recognition particle receptor subunit beta n=1 Tax=Seminavis robusta TaxID=568900 RepID=A0A9N8EYG4_9STRA|nr:expressed unknown protein [Seminavis robusta]|eukprot:Sro2120_g315420.1 n/a (314) ;mRNA; f:11652-12672